MSNAQIFRDGDWLQTERDPIAERFSIDGCAVPDLVARCEYTVFTLVRHFDAAPLGLTVYRGPVRRTPNPAWVVVLDAPPVGDGPAQYAYVYADKLSDVMDLLREWGATLWNLSSAEVAAHNVAEEEGEDD